MKEALEKNLKLLKVCNTGGVENGCLKPNQYVGFDDIIKSKNPDITDEELAQQTKGCGVITKNQLLNVSTVYVLASGSTIISHTLNSPPVAAVIDINGQKGPNKWGYDVFRLGFLKDGTSYKMYPSGCSIVEEGGISSLKMYKQVFGN